MGRITDTTEWQEVAHHFDWLRDLHLRDLFAADDERGTTLAVEADGLYFDYSKNRVTAETIRLLVALAERAGLRDRIDAMFA
ncbi:MAG: glucose-6-phosphate isomerase, partial [Actinomycetota bacterium]|nr:glucose-6-phosphate isomerase [Actinomycetota bacterium]